MIQDTIDVFLITGDVVTIPIREDADLEDAIESANGPSDQMSFSAMDYRGRYVSINGAHILYTAVNGPRITAHYNEQLAAKRADH